MIDDHLRRQDGVITVAQARRCGLSVDAVNRRVRRGRWRRCAPGVYFVDDRPFTNASRIRASVWACGPNAVASGEAAVWWHGLTESAPDVVEVTVPKTTRLRSKKGVDLRRRDLMPADIVEHRRLRLTALPLTVLEAAVGRNGARIMDTALQTRLNLSELQAAHLRNAGRRGAPIARDLLQAAATGARSEAERLLIDLLNAAQISGWYANHPVGGYSVDVAFPAIKVAIEVDGWAFHSSHADFVADRRRQNKLALMGWQVLRFTWLDLTEQPERVIAEIQRAISGA